MEDKHDSNALFDALKVTYGPKYNNFNCSIKDIRNGFILTKTFDINNSWREHLERLLTVRNNLEEDNIYEFFTIWNR